MPAATLRFGDLRIEGWSRAGEETWFRVHPPGLALDVGRGALQLAGARDLFVTHGHLDHALGVPYVLSQRSLHHLADSRVFCPRALVPALGDLIAAAERMEEVRYRYQLVGLEPGQRVEVGRDLAVEAFAVDHVVASLGYHLVRGKRRLAAAYRDHPPQQLAMLRRQGVDIEEVVEEICLSYCGDTGPGVFELEPRLYETTVLMLECTFIGAGLEERGARYRHLHLADLAERVERFENRDLVLYHLSRRHRVDELRQAAAEALAALKPRLHVLELGEEGR